MKLDGLSTAEVDALSRLDETEIAALAAIRNKLNGGDEVSGYSLNFGQPATQAWNVAPNTQGVHVNPLPQFADGNFVW
jgi:hypothetical protein